MNFSPCETPLDYLSAPHVTDTSDQPPPDQLAEEDTNFGRKGKGKKPWFNR